MARAVHGAETSESPRLPVPSTTDDVASGPAWFSRALCLKSDPELRRMWFPTSEGEKATQAKQVCSHCTAKSPCLADALSNSE